MQYSKENRFTVTGGVANCVPLQTPMRGTLSRISIKQISGTAVAYTFSILDRKGASTVANDLHTTNGTVTSIGNSSGSASITFAAAHGLSVGDTIEIKGNAVSGYNVTHTVVSITSTTVAVTNIAYSSVGAGGYWQTTPFIDTHDPGSHLVYPLTSVNSGDAHRNFDVKSEYENRDNQSVTARRKATALYLEITPGGTGSKVFEISYTVLAPVAD